MANLVTCDGFDHYRVDDATSFPILKWDSFSIQGSASAGFGNSSGIKPSFGRPSLSDSNTGGLYAQAGIFFGTTGAVQWFKNYNAQLTTIYTGFALKIVQPPSGSSSADAVIFGVQDSTTPQVELRCTAAGNFYFTRNGTTIGSTSASALSFNTWAYVETKIVINGSTGSVELRVNGTNTGWISSTGLNTKNSSNAYATRFWLGCYDTGGSSACPSFYFDDMYVHQTTFLGDVRVNGMLATGDGTLNQWSRTIAAWPTSTAVKIGTQILDSNSNMQQVTSISGTGTTGGSAPSWNTTVGATTTDNAGANQVVWTNRGTAADWKTISESSPDSDYSYLADSTVGDQTRFTYPSISGTTVFDVVVWMFSDKDDAGTRILRAVTKSGSTVGDNGVDLAQGSTYTYQAGIFETDPNTGSAWTVSAVNSAEFGVKVVS